MAFLRETSALGQIFLGSRKFVPLLVVAKARLGIESEKAHFILILSRAWTTIFLDML